jgi:hypothetical protein
MVLFFVRVPSGRALRSTRAEGELTEGNLLVRSSRKGFPLRSLTRASYYIKEYTYI